MAKIFKSNYRKVKLPKSKHASDEFGGGKKGILICENCGIFYYKKSWHHNADKFIAKRENKDLPVGFTLCPACTMIRNKQYEGILLVKNVPADKVGEVIKLIKNYGKRAYEIDPLDRVIEIKEEGGMIIVKTTENELASKLAKKIKDAFNKVKTKISFSREPGDLARAEVVFLGK